MTRGTALTIVDVARLSGVSKSTVSRVLSGAANVSSDAREKVEAAVAASGFRRNNLARSLRSGRSGMLGLLIPDIANPFWAEVARGAQDAASERGQTLLILNSDWDAERERRHLRALVRSRVDGAIVNPVHNGVEEIAHFDVPLVLIGSTAARFPHLPSVGSDISQGVALGLERLAAAGLRAPALLVGDAERTARERFVAAIRDRARAMGWDAGGILLENGNYTVEGGRDGMARLLARGRPGADAGFDCVFAANDLMALGALRAVREAGLACPGDVAILGFDGIPAGEVSAPRLTTIVKPAREIGGRAFELLAARIEGNGEAGHLTLACAFCERDSLPATGRHARLRAV